MLEYLKAKRRDLHQIPELGLDCFLTSNYLEQELESMGYSPIIMAKTGVIVFKPGKTNTTLGFRADMDGLSVKEESGVDFVSHHIGNMHACGHDGHMAMLLGFAKYCSNKEFNVSILFIFQPAEEGPGGAKVLIDEGLFKRFPTNAIFGLHLYPNLTEGKFALIQGPMMAQTNEFDCIIHGKSAHGAQPHLGKDAIVLQAEIIQAFQSIISRSINPLEPSVLTVGTIHGGEARNIIAQKVTLEGTIRCFNPEVFKVIQTRMNDIASTLSKVNDVSVELIFKSSYPPVINPKALYEIANNILTENEKENIQAMMFAEDFSFYQKEVPAFFAMLGSKNLEKNYTHPLHSCFFNFDETVLEIGTNYYIRLLEHYNLGE
jgi:amidohydrolase